MRDLSSLEKARKVAFEKYQAAMRNMTEIATSPEIAQQANDAWLEFKKLDVDFSNQSIMKKLGDLYGC